MRLRSRKWYEHERYKAEICWSKDSLLSMMNPRFLACVAGCRTEFWSRARQGSRLADIQLETCEKTDYSWLKEAKKSASENEMNS